ncbi:MAG: hypothetical protein ACO3TE_08460, partial [bacterium]
NIPSDLNSPISKLIWIQRNLKNLRRTWIGGTTPVVTEGLSSTESQQEVEIQFDSRYALRRTS